MRLKVARRATWWRAYRSNELLRIEAAENGQARPASAQKGDRLDICDLWRGAALELEPNGLQGLGERMP